MKRRYAAMVLGLALTLTSVNFAYASESTAETEAADTTESTTDEDTENTVPEVADNEVYGEVTEIGEDSISIKVGTLNMLPGGEMKGEAPDGGKLETPPAEDDAAEAAGDTETADAEETDETAADAEETDDTAADETGGGEDGQKSQSMLELTGETQTIQVTDSTTYEKETAPEAGEGDAAAPAGEETEDTAETDAEEADTAEADAEEADTAETDTEETDAAEADAADTETAGKDMAEGETPAPEMPTELISLEEIKAGDIVKIILDEDGNASAVTVMRNNMEE